MSNRVDLDTVHPAISRITAPNPGPKTLEGTNLYFVGTEDRVLIDAGPDDHQFLESLARTVGNTVTSIALTHDHPDHAGGAEYLSRLLDVPVWMSSQVSPAIRRSIRNARTLEAEQAFPVGGGMLRAIATPGHSWDHVGYWYESSRVLFAGDTVLGRGTTLIALPEGDIGAYLETLGMIASMKPDRIAPGHGPMVSDPAATLDMYMRHRHERLEELLAAFGSTQTVEAVVEAVYRPESEAIRQLATLSVGAQVEYLVKQGRLEGDADAGYRTRAVS